MIDDVSIAASRLLETSRLDWRTAASVVTPGLSGDFGEHLRESASAAAIKSDVRSDTEGLDRRSQSVRDRQAAARETADNFDGDSDQVSSDDRDPTAVTRPHVVPGNIRDTSPVDPSNHPQVSGKPDQSGDPASEVAPAAGFTQDSTWLVSATSASGLHAESRIARAAAANQGPGGVLPIETPIPSARTETVLSLSGGLLKTGSAESHRPVSPTLPNEALTTLSSEAITITQKQANGLAKAVGDGNRTEVAVTVSKDAKSLLSQPSFAPTTGAATSTEGGRSNPGRSAGGERAANALPGPLNPATMPTQTQLVGAQQASSPLPAQLAATPNSIAPNLVPATPGGSPVAASEAVEGDPVDLGGTSNGLRVPGPSVAQAGGPARSAHQPSPIVHQISVNITKAIGAGMDKIEIRLRPESLGRVEVSLEVARDGRVVAMVTAESRETLELLRADARGLERALQEAGLKADSGSLSFGLRGHDTAGRNGGGSDQNLPASESDGGEAAGVDESLDATNAVETWGNMTADGRVDIRA